MNGAPHQLLHPVEAESRAKGFIARPDRAESAFPVFLPAREGQAVGGDPPTGSEFCGRDMKKLAPPLSAAIAQT